MIKPYALITGGSKGIGYSLAKEFAKDGYNLVLVARHIDELNTAGETLKNTYGIDVLVLAKDLSIPQSRYEIFQELQNKKIEIDTLVNNAGFGDYGFFWQRDLKKQLEMIQTNIAAVVELCYLFIPQMIKRGSGRIMNVSSDGAFIPGGPLMSVYFATKAFDFSFSQAIGNELADYGIRVTTLCPGVTNTNFNKRADRLITPPPFPKPLTPDAVAEEGYRKFKQGKPFLIAGNLNKVMVFLMRFMPRNLLVKIARDAQKDTAKK